MLKQFGFRRKMLYICIAKRREPVNTGFSPLFFCKNRAKMGCFTKHVGKSTCLRKISTGFSGFFSGQVGAQIDDIESRKGNYSGQYYPLAHAQLLPSISTRVQKCELKRL